MANSRENRLRRRELFDLDPHCFWCGRLTQWIELEGGTFPLDAATLEHIHSRYTPGRRQAEGNPTVLACWECNNDRSRTETAALPLWELWRRSDAYPLGWPSRLATGEEEGA